MTNVQYKSPASQIIYNGQSINQFTSMQLSKSITIHYLLYGRREYYAGAGEYFRGGHRFFLEHEKGVQKLFSRYFIKGSAYIK